MTKSIGLKFVPGHKPATPEDINKLKDFITCAKKLLVLTGAGISTESGIPDYRSEGVGLYATSPNRPVNYKDFLDNGSVRKRYWARNYVGWTRFSSMKPNVNHFCLTDWEKAGHFHWLITQNVDRLHHKAGTEKIIELHGTTFRVICLNCSKVISRFLLQNILKDLNPSFNIESLEVRPDGDVELNSELLSTFHTPLCDNCGGILKPDVVFFGETIPKERIKLSYNKMAESDALLVLGSSLQVFSAYRFILEAVEKKKQIAIVNIGPTRGDHFATLKVDAQCGDILPKLGITIIGNI